MRYQRLQLGGSLVLFFLDEKEKERPVNNFRGSRSRVLVARTEERVLHCVKKEEGVTSLSKGEGLQWPRTCQGPESMLLHRSGLTMASSVSGLRVIREGDLGLFMGVF